MCSVSFDLLRCVSPITTRPRRLTNVFAIFKQALFGRSWGFRWKERLSESIVLPFITQWAFCCLTVLVLFQEGLHCSKCTFHGTVNKVKAAHRRTTYETKPGPSDAERFYTDRHTHTNTHGQKSTSPSQRFNTCFSSQGSVSMCPNTNPKLCNWISFSAFLQKKWNHETGKQEPLECPDVCFSKVLIRLHGRVSVPWKTSRLVIGYCFAKSEK